MAKKPAAKKGDGGKRAAKDKAKKTASASKGTKAVRAPKRPPEEVMRVASEGTLKATMNKVLKLEKDGATAQGNARQAVSEQPLIHAAAFRDVKKLIKKGDRDPAALRAYLDERERYEDIFGIEDLAGSSLFQTQEVGEDDDAGEDDQPQEPVGDNVVNLGNGNGEARLAS